MIDWRRSVDIPMHNKRTGEVDFKVQVYGRSAADLSTIPNDVVMKLAQRYPNHTSSPFMMRDLSR